VVKKECGNSTDSRDRKRGAALAHLLWAGGKKKKAGERHLHRQDEDKRGAGTRRFDQIDILPSSKKKREERYTVP